VAQASFENIMKPPSAAEAFNATWPGVNHNWPLPSDPLRVPDPREYAVAILVGIIVPKPNRTGGHSNGLLRVATYALAEGRKG
jgi:hypothetical protein